MAIWQFTIMLVPRTWAETEGHVPGMLYDADGYSDTSIAWRHKQLDVDIDLDDLMSQVLPAATSWSDEIKIWGDVGTSDIQVYREGTTIESMRVRIDTRNNTPDLCLKIVQLARALDCHLFLPEHRSIISPDGAALSNAVRKSSAAQYAADPHAFLESRDRGLPGKQT